MFGLLKKSWAIVAAVIRVLTLLCVLVTQLISAQTNQAISCGPQPSSNPYQLFICAPSDANWQRLVEASIANNGLPYASIVILLDKYHERRVSRDLPNSMALERSPNAAVSDTVSALAADFALIQNVNGQQVRQIVACTIRQPTADDDLVWTMAELDYRLSLRDFDNDRDYLVVNNSPHLSILDEVRDRFVAGGGHIAGW